MARVVGTPHRSIAVLDHQEAQQTMKQARIEISTGARVRKRGGAMDEGTVVAVSPRYRGWVDIAWDAGHAQRARPLVCHVNELEVA